MTAPQAQWVPGLTGFFEHDEKGAEITRPWSCRMCGTKYEQHIICAKYLEALEQHRPRALEAIIRDIPGFWLPTLCPPCERKKLSYGAYTVPDDR